MRQSTKNAIIRRAIKRALPDEKIQAAFAGTLPKAEAYGFHPTKKGPGRA